MKGSLQGLFNGTKGLIIFFPPSKIRMADVRKINMTSLILTSKEVVHNKEYRIKPQGIHCLLCAKQFSSVTFV